MTEQEKFFVEGGEEGEKGVRVEGDVEMKARSTNVTDEGGVVLSDKDLEERRAQNANEGWREPK